MLQRQRSSYGTPLDATRNHTEELQDALYATLANELVAVCDALETGNAEYLPLLQRCTQRLRFASSVRFTAPSTAGGPGKAAVGSDEPCVAERLLSARGDVSVVSVLARLLLPQVTANKRVSRLAGLLLAAAPRACAEVLATERSATSVPQRLCYAVRSVTKELLSNICASMSLSEEPQSNCAALPSPPLCIRW